jgi:uncharacterized protein YqgC (DUF456 family)
VLHILGIVVFLLILVAGLVVIPFGIPGTFIIVLDSFVYGLATHFERVTLGFVGILLAISLAVEAVEFVLGALAARKYGSSSWGMWGALIGGFFGALWLTSLFPPLGTFLGAFVGAFAGAFVFELLSQRDVDRALKAGWGAFLGALGGKLLKIVTAVGMIIAVAVQVF